MTQLHLPMALPAEREPPPRPEPEVCIPHPDLLEEIEDMCGYTGHPAFQAIVRHILAGGQPAALEWWAASPYAQWWAAERMVVALERDYDSTPDWRPAEVLPEDYYAGGGG